MTAIPSAVTVAAHNVSRRAVAEAVADPAEAAGLPPQEHPCLRRRHNHHKAAPDPPLCHRDPLRLPAKTVVCRLNASIAVTVVTDSSMSVMRRNAADLAIASTFPGGSLEGHVHPIPCAASRIRASARVPAVPARGGLPGDPGDRKAPVDREDQKAPVDPTAHRVLEVRKVPAAPGFLRAVQVPGGIWHVKGIGVRS